MEQAHRLVASVAGELSLALVRGKSDRAQMTSWVDRLQQVLDAFRAKLEKTR